MALSSGVPDRCPSSPETLWPSAGTHYHIPSEEVPQTCNKLTHGVSRDSDIIFYQAVSMSTQHRQGTLQQDPPFDPIFSVGSAATELSGSIAQKHTHEEDIHQTTG